MSLMVSLVCSAVSSDNQAEVMKTLVESLPEENYASLRYLITFLARVQQLTLRTVPLQSTSSH